MKANKACGNRLGKVVGLILVSKYMVKRYGFEEACKRIIERNKHKRDKNIIL